MISYLRSGIPSAGIFAGPSAWLLNTQINYALVPWICAHHMRLVPLVACVMAALSLFGGFLSWRAYDRASITPQPDSSGAGRPHRFTAATGIGMALLFALVIIVQGTAGIVFHGCER
ncbi:hypothetical protein [Microvirga rosea]|uniref:hypothetical protein n=1 Tax=Microvirga rosea TaxID=2715425 RepID=UPI001D0AF312|nr:hypothetical protein [Microvirga rosea]MCB8821795.1 hypothetical protein [Microvirga rosea]